MSVWAVILCGGRGSRMGAGMNKTLLFAGDAPVFVKSLRALKPFAAGTVLVCGEGEEELFRSEAEKYSCLPDRICTGGIRRQDSVLNALRLLPEECDTVAVHDGARCFADAGVIRRALESAEKFGSGVAAVPLRDTVKRADPDGRVLETYDRSQLRAVQTPQVFRKKELLDAYERFSERDVTDDASLMELAGRPVMLTEGSMENIKVTYPGDLPGPRSPLRVGTGFDAHRLTEGRELVLCGVKIPWEKGLLGHSDADAASHALTDAILGAAAMGDIGKLFPDSDERYRGIDSQLLLREAYRRVREKGYSLVNADITVTAQAPKLAPYIERMRDTLAETLETEPDRISVKATTTERMGYEGRGEGISASATVLLEKLG